MFVWRAGRPFPVISLARLSQEKMMSVNDNKDRTWVGSSAPSGRCNPSRQEDRRVNRAVSEPDRLDSQGTSFAMIRIRLNRGMPQRLELAL